MERQPAVAGQFYPANRDKLRALLAGLVPRTVPSKALGVVSPHAGYVYSGGVAGETLAQVHIPDRVVILGPNHQGLGPSAALYSIGSWQTPLGTVAIDEPLARKLLEDCKLLSADSTAHRFEHSLEVQVPFLQYLNPEVRIVPICLGRVGLDELLSFGADLGECLKQAGGEILMVASSDMTHYESAAQAREKDTAAIDKILALDPEGLYQVVAARHISMCGVIPTVAMLAACRHMGARGATLVRYTNSGAVTGDTREVVGYAGVVIT
ncbi:AmmeMemoRadiSam system protein B [Geoalkalibacter halelectricus]|uniref:AmmeMemoRadiSam system protein B n=1 Tax=Geoalkalibacter halelectricus TaxID=2847045 RepID=UPI003D1CDBD9